MEQQKFYDHVSKWIKSYHNADALEWLRKFINSSQQPVHIKEKLHREIDIKIAALKNKPCFADINGDTWLVDYEGHPRVYTTRFSAIVKLAELKMRGYNAELAPGNVFYRIRLAEPAPIDELAACGC
jgi:hypothetical protein